MLREVASCTIALILNQIISLRSMFFILLLINIEVIAFIEGLKLVSKPMRETEKCAMLVVAKISATI